MFARLILGNAIREAETAGIPWPEVNKANPKAKHSPNKPENRRTKVSPHAAAALRLLIFTGARLREILDLKWDHVDLQRGLLFLPDSKTGKKTIVLGGPQPAFSAILTERDDTSSSAAIPIDPEQIYSVPGP